MDRVTLWVAARRVIAGILLALCASVVIAIFPQVNVHIWSGVPWFVAPEALFCIVVVLLSKSWIPARGLAGTDVAKDVAYGAALGAVAVLLTWLQVTPGATVTLPGDRLVGSASFQTIASGTILIVSPVIEEAIFRGWLQFALQRDLGPRWSEASADIAFVVAHFDRLWNPSEAVFLCILAAVNGRVATRTGAVLHPMLVHLLANTVVLVAALITRA